jgi:phosphatidyl-myo-inositol dimannoside synthase
MTTSVLVSGSYFPPQVGGISYLMAEICASLGPGTVSVLTGVPAAGADETSLRSLKIYRRPRAFDADRAGNRFWLTLALAEMVVRERPRLLQFATIENTDTAWWAHRTLRLPYVVYAHGNDILSAIRNEWQKPRQVLGQAARVIANSRYTAGLVEQAGVDPRRIEIVHPGCDIDRFQPRRIDPAARRAVLGDRSDMRIVLTVGNLVERKGHDVAMRAMQRVIRRVPDTCYLIAGDGPHRAALEKLAGELGIAHRVVFAGRIASDQLPVYYNLCDVFLMPSRARLEQDDVEGFGMVFLEAGACGKPSIGGRSGGIADAIVDGKTGVLVDPGDPAQVADALETLLEAPTLAEKFGKQARDHVVTEHNWPRTGARIDAILRQVANES